MAVQVISFLKEKPFSKSEIAKRLGKTKPTRYLNDLMAKLLREGYVEYTIPGKPKSRLQKYRLTKKGRKIPRELPDGGNGE
ncbi:MAG: ATP-dependent DNA helicase [Deltaproteobacteria bacterium]|nr:ATP-dependent DNA helicase [Deltaproteobacteria bacterium]